jgi:uncharacterized membrane protein YccC
MRILEVAGVRSVLRKVQWQRGVRAAIAVGSAMGVCLWLHRPIGWAALGALYICLVDNGGPYRSRLGNIASIALLGSLAAMLGAVANVNVVVGMVVTVAFFFAMTLARVVSQPLASTSVLILICYIVAFGGGHKTLGTAAADGGFFLAGGLWAALLALALWPVDPFKPAREAVASLYDALALFAAQLSADTERSRDFNEALARVRVRIEAAQTALADTPARMTARTIRARNLAVLVEDADLLMARILRFAEMAEVGHAETSLVEIRKWLLTALAPIAPALRQRPIDNTASFAREGSLSVDLRRATLLRVETVQMEAGVLSNEEIRDSQIADGATGGVSADYVVAALRDAQFNFELAYEAVRAVWTGAESRQKEAAEFRAALTGAPSAVSSPAVWLEALRSNLTPRSVMFRHALRLSAVIAVDVLLTRYIHVTHSYWFAMTSLIVLRPFAGETVRKSAERVVGTVAGGLLAAGFTAVLTSPAETLVLVTMCAAGSVALYSVEYAWYCFFVTPTVVLLTLPKLHDWHLAAVRMEMTVLGAVVSLLAMLLLWPERESLQLPGMLARGAAADAAYLRALMVFWEKTERAGASERIAVERAVLAPARRACGLAVNDAEETLDHALLEHAIPLNPRAEPTKLLNSAALTFTTYLRRMTRTVTTLAATGMDEAQRPVLGALASRMDAVARALGAGGAFLPVADTAVVEGEQLKRLAMQVAVLERTAAELKAIG